MSLSSSRPFIHHRIPVLHHCPAASLFLLLGEELVSLQLFQSLKVYVKLFWLSRLSSPRVYHGKPGCCFDSHSRIHAFPAMGIFIPTMSDHVLKEIIRKVAVAGWTSLADIFVNSIFAGCYQLELCHELLVNQLNGHLLQAHTGCEPKDHFRLEEERKSKYWN